jgi:hypothetical protein
MTCWRNCHSCCAVTSEVLHTLTVDTSKLPPWLVHLL